MSDKVIIDPRQTQAIWNYKDPSSPTFGNLKQSMISAGYDERYADTIYDRKPLWLTDNMQSTIDMVEKAERNLKRSIDMDINLDNPTKTELELLKIQLDSSKFTLKTLAKSKYEPETEKADTNIQVNIIKQGKTIDVKANEPYS